MRKITVRSAAAVAAFLIVAALLSPLGAAADEYPHLTGMSITPEGVLSWDAVPGNEQYWVGVNGGYVPADIGCDITDRLPSPGVYEITVDAVADNGSKTLATGTVQITFNGKSSALGTKSALGGWWGTSSNDHIASVTVDGADIPSTGGEFIDPGREVNIIITPAEGRDILSAFLRFDGQNRDEFALTERSDGSYEGKVTSPDAVWTIGINTRSTQPEFVLHDVDFGRVSEGFLPTQNTVMVNLRNGKIPLPSGSSYMKTEWISGDASAFATDVIYDSNYAEPYSVYHFWVCPGNGLTEGSYAATLALYYDKDGAATNWVKVDECTVKVKVVKPGTPVTASNWWCTGGDYVESFEINGAEFSSALQLVPGDTVSATVRPRAGYDVSGVFLRYNDQIARDGVTLAPKEGGAYAVTFTVPENDFAIGVDVKEAETAAIAVEFSFGGGSGSMETVFVNPGDYAIPECGFTDEPGRFVGWSVEIYKNGNWEELPGGLYQPGTLITAEGEKMRLSAMWGEGLTPDDTSASGPDETSADSPESEPDATSAVSTESGPEVTSDEPVDETEDTTDGNTGEQGGQTRGPLPWILLGLGIGVVLSAGAAVAVVLLLKKRRR